MRIQTTSLIVLLAVITSSCSQEESTKDIQKRRGWGKRSPVPGFDDQDLDKRRGWGKRDASVTDPEEIFDYDKRRGWGKRTLDTDANGIQKRRGWGKRSELSGSPDGESPEKRRGWGKRSSDPDVANIQMTRRRGWGKRDSAEQYPDKRRGWGKRSSANDLLGQLKQKGWNKLTTTSTTSATSGSGNGSWQADEPSCQELRDEVFSYVYKAVEVNITSIIDLDFIQKESDRDHQNVYFRLHGANIVLTHDPDFGIVLDILRQLDPSLSPI
ncbi:hypothetical protein LSH36_1446g00005 [Paralvinella palmiformis]|uniref:Uncharacterized protein n=1 Tax=Paralvinella palmiformis TaxID=53620 RepID=A0AAD9IU87_9ANNE|nr:hypothetical protein LSH36_1446g00005 [Paralvinella palmiformis]